LFLFFLFLCTLLDANKGIISWGDFIKLAEPFLLPAEARYLQNNAVTFDTELPANISAAVEDKNSDSGVTARGVLSGDGKKVGGAINARHRSRSGFNDSVRSLSEEEEDDENDEELEEVGAVPSAVAAAATGSGARFGAGAQRSASSWNNQQDASRSRVPAVAEFDGDEVELSSDKLLDSSENSPNTSMRASHQSQAQRHGGRDLLAGASDPSGSYSSTDGLDSSAGGNRNRNWAAASAGMKAGAGPWRQQQQQQQQQLQQR
jgi:hypothetical protein